MFYYEVFFENYEPDWSICIKGTRMPSVKEANAFCAADVKKFGRVTKVLPLTPIEAANEFDLSNEDNWPIFGEGEIIDD